jgi:hypothetical protein
VRHGPRPKREQAIQPQAASRQPEKALIEHLLVFHRSFRQAEEVMTIKMFRTLFVLGAIAALSASVVSSRLIARLPGDPWKGEG